MSLRLKVKINVTENQVRVTIPKNICKELKINETVDAELFVDDWREKEDDEEQKVIVILPVRKKSY